MARERDVNAPGGGHDLRNYWVRGEGAAKIGWGTDGSFARCVSHLGKHVKNPQGLCAEYHKAATGEWPAEKGVESSMSGLEEFHGTHRQKDHGNWARNGNGGDTSSPSYDSMTDATEVVDRLKSSGAVNRTDAEWTGSPDADPDNEVIGIINEWINEETNEDSAVGRLQDLGIDPHEIDLDYLATLVEQARSGGAEMHGAMKTFHGQHNQQDHDPTKGKSSLDKLKSLVGLKPGDVKVPSLSREEKKKLSEYDRRLFNDVDLTPAENAEYRALQKKQKSTGNVERDDESGDDDDEDRFKDGDYALTAAVKKKKKIDSETLMTYVDEPWEGVLVVEGVESGDSRLFGLGSLDWAELPMPLQYQPANIGGHNGSVTVGEITQAARKGNEIVGWGNVFGTALAGEHGDGIRNNMKVGGVSVDVDSVKDADVEMVYADSEGGDNPFAKPETTIFHRGRIRGATLVAFPAFVEAKLNFTGALAASATPSGDCGCDGTTVLTASSHTITIPNLPPAHWFNEPVDVVSYGALTITDEGRVFGVVAPADTTHRNVKTKVPRNLDFSRFLKGETIVEGGGRVVTGVITASCGHAATQNYGTLNNRLQHYDNSCSVLANVNVGYARDGAIWVAGALNPGADGGQVAQALGCALSLDVQPHPDRQGVREFIAAHLVPVPGFPLARTKASVLYNDGVLSAAAVPVDFTDQPRVAEFDVYHLVQSTKLALAESIGRDPASRKQALLSSLER